MSTEPTNVGGIQEPKRGRVLISLLLASLLTVVACGGDGKPGPVVETATPLPTASPATATPVPSVSLASLGIQTTPVRWVKVEGFLNDPVEPPDPFALEREHYTAQPGPTSSTGPQDWSIQVVGPAGTPKELYSTKRWLTGLAWGADDKLSANYISRRAYRIPGFDSQFVLPARGVSTISATNGHLEDQWDAQLPNYTPLPLGIAEPGSTFPSISVENGGDGKMLIAVIYGSGPFQVIQVTYIVGATGETVKLEGISGLRGLSWLPGGNGLRALKSFSSFPPNNDTYLIPLRDGDAMFIGSSPLVAEGGASGAMGSTPTRVVVILRDPKPGAAADASIMVLHDIVTGRTRVLGPGPAYPATGPSGLPNQLPMIWPAGSNSFQIGFEANTQIVDVNTGAITPGKLPQFTPQPSTPPAARRGAESPNGRYVVTFEDPPLQSYQSTAECRGLPYKMELEDKQSGTAKTLIECKGGTVAGGFWLGDERFLVRVSSCAGPCDANESRSLIVEVATGKVTPLSETFESNAFVLFSPDKSKMLLGGSALRLFSQDGNLISRLDVPQGYQITQAVWSPDGSSYAFIQGPSAWYSGGP